MLTREDVLRVREIHSTLYEATRNPIYYAFVQAYDIVLGDEIPPGLANKDLDSLMYKWKKENSLKNHR